MAQDAKDPRAKATKPYQKPAIVYSKKTEARAVSCSRSTDQCGPTGPITS